MTSVVWFMVDWIKIEMIALKPCPQFPALVPTAGNDMWEDEIPGDLGSRNLSCFVLLGSYDVLTIRTSRTHNVADTKNSNLSPDKMSESCSILWCTRFELSARLDVYLRTEIIRKNRRVCLGVKTCTYFWKMLRPAEYSSLGVWEGWGEGTQALRKSAPAINPKKMREQDRYIYICIHT